VFTVLIFTDGRNDFLERTLTSFTQQVKFPGPVSKILIDDMPQGRDLALLQDLAARFAIDRVVLNETNLGVFATVQKGWTLVQNGAPYIFHLENDFVFLDSIDVGQMVAVLQEPWIVNITLLRQPWYEDERAAGGLMRKEPEKFRAVEVRGVPVCLHQEYFGHNPGLYRREFARPVADYTEFNYRDLLIREDPSRHFAILGRSGDPPRVLHIGTRRVGKSPDYR
jgi:hypothetical protein